MRLTIGLAVLVVVANVVCLWTVNEYLEFILEALFT